MKSQKIPKLSIVTITYRDIEGLSKTLESLKPLATNTELTWEHVVIDSSPELTIPVIEDLSATWPLIYHTVPPKGIYSAINSGIERLKGDYVWFLNGGDLLYSKEVLESALARLAESPEIDLLVAGVALQRNEKFQYSQFPKTTLLRGLLGSNKVAHQGVIYKRRVFERVGNYSLSFPLAADYEHFFKIYLAGLQVERINKVLAVFNSGGLSDNYVKAFREFKQIQRKFYDRLPRSIRFFNELQRRWEYGRVAAIKILANSPVAPILRPIWLFLKRILNAIESSHFR